MHAPSPNKDFQGMADQEIAEELLKLDIFERFKGDVAWLMRVYDAESSHQKDVEIRLALVQANPERSGAIAPSDIAIPDDLRFLKIVSGGQTGADRAALDWAIHHDLLYGGWCPKGRIAEDGIIDSRYCLIELEGGYRQRTRQNVIDSMGTLILNLGELDGGSLETQRFAERHGKPCLTLQLEQDITQSDIDWVHGWMQRHRVWILNVAGPRESKRTGIYAMTYQALNLLLGPRHGGR